MQHNIKLFFQQKSSLNVKIQKHFRNQIKELNQDGYQLGEESIYHPVKRKRFKRPWWTYSLIGIILFLVTFSSLPVKIYNDVIVYKDGKMYDYLNTSKQYDIQSDMIVRNLVAQAAQLSSISLPELQREKTTVNRLTVETEKLKAPSIFKKHKETLIDVIQQRLFIITYLELLAKTGSPYSGELTPHINELNVKQELKRSALIDAFEEANIEYTIQVDGTIQYQYKSYLNRKYQP